MKRYVLCITMRMLDGRQAWKPIFGGTHPQCVEYMKKCDISDVQLVMSAGSPEFAIMPKEEWDLLRKRQVGRR